MLETEMPVNKYQMMIEIYETRVEIRKYYARLAQAELSYLQNKTENGKRFLEVLQDGLIVMQRLEKELEKKYKEEEKNE